MTTTRKVKIGFARLEGYKPRAPIFRKHKSRCPDFYMVIEPKLEQELVYLGVDYACMYVDRGFDQQQLLSQTHSPARVEFECDHGRLEFTCDLFFEWSANMLAIVDTLALLRRLGSMGVIEHGAQYKPFRVKARAAPREPPPRDRERSPPKDPPKDPPPPPPPKEGFTGIFDAAAYICVRAGFSRDAMTSIVLDPAARQQAYRRAAKACHPDLHGPAATAEFVQLNLAKEILDRGYV